jgi:hypothetical protein
LAADNGDIESLRTEGMQHLVDINPKGVFLPLKYGTLHR